MIDSMSFNALNKPALRRSVLKYVLHVVPITYTFAVVLSLITADQNTTTAALCFVLLCLLHCKDAKVIVSFNLNG